MKKSVFLLLFSLSFTMFAQQKSDFWDKVRFGGGVALNFGNPTTIGISPSAIYQFDNGVSLGPGVTYIYNKFNDASTNVLGASIISLYQIPKIGIQLSGEYEYSFAKQKVGNNTSSSEFPALYLGAAYNIGNFALGFRYDVLYDSNSIYPSAFSPIARFYF